MESLLTRQSLRGGGNKRCPSRVHGTAILLSHYTLQLDETTGGLGSSNFLLSQNLGYLAPPLSRDATSGPLETYMPPKVVAEFGQKRGCTMKEELNLFCVTCANHWQTHWTF